MSLHPPTTPRSSLAPTPTAPTAPPSSESQPTPNARPTAQAMIAWLGSPDGPADEEVTPRSGRRKWRRTAVVTALLAFLCVGAAGWSALALLEYPAQNLGLEYQKVERGKVTFTIVEKGEVEAYRNTELLCKVRNRSGDWMATTIKWLVDDGTQVRRGDVVMRLDDTNLRDRLQAQTIAVTEKRALLFEAEREQEIIHSQNEIAIKTAINNEKIARLSLDGKMKLSRAELEQWEEKATWSARMVKQGFMSN